MRWTGQIERVRGKVGQLLGVLGRASGVLGGRSLLALYNGLVLPHLQYCLMVWGDFKEGRNLTLAGSLLRYQKRFAGLAAERRGVFHADPLFAAAGMLKVGDLYRQQLRVHAWRFWNDRLPPTRRPCWEGLGMSMDMPQGLPDLGCSSPRGTTDLWDTGSPRNGRRWLRIRGGWARLRRLRGRRGWGSWRVMGALGAGWGVVGYVQEGEL